MTRHRPPTIQVVNADDEPYLLVRAETAEQARELAHTYLVQRGDVLLEFFGSPEPPPVNPVRDGWWRWVPARPDEDYAFWLHPAKAGGRGAFYAWRVEIGLYPVGGEVGVGAA